MLSLGLSSDAISNAEESENSQICKHVHIHFNMSSCSFNNEKTNLIHVFHFHAVLVRWYKQLLIINLQNIINFQKNFNSSLIWYKLFAREHLHYYSFIKFFCLHSIYLYRYLVNKKQLILVDSVEKVPTTPSVAVG